MHVSDGFSRGVVLPSCSQDNANTSMLHPEEVPVRAYHLKGGWGGKVGRQDAWRARNHILLVALL